MPHFCKLETKWEPESVQEELDKPPVMSLMGFQKKKPLFHHNGVVLAGTNSFILKNVFC